MNAQTKISQVAADAYMATGDMEAALLAGLAAEGRVGKGRMPPDWAKVQAMQEALRKPKPVMTPEAKAKSMATRKAMGEATCRAILGAISVQAKSAPEIARACDMPLTKVLSAIRRMRVAGRVETRAKRGKEVLLAPTVTKGEAS